MPFFWSEIASKGQIYGNRNLGNKVDVPIRIGSVIPDIAKL